MEARAALRIGIIGLAGRSGRALAEEVVAAGHELAGGLLHVSKEAPPGAAVLPDLTALAAVSDVVIDFTVPSAAITHAAVLAAASTPWILGTTGLSASENAAVIEAATMIPVVHSENFSLGITLLMEVATRMAAFLPAERYDAEIVEMHHRQKIDAPSGTAILLGRSVAVGRGVDLAEAMQSGRDGHTGLRRTGDIGFSAVRGGQVVGEHSLIFAGDAEHLSLTHRVFDRRVFAQGAIVAAAWASARPAGLYDMRDVTCR